jgi:hypothetical protein
MHDDVLTLGLKSIRRTDSNSLLRMYDRAAEILRSAPSEQDRARADKAIPNIAAELAKRHVPL